MEQLSQEDVKIAHLVNSTMNAASSREGPREEVGKPPLPSSDNPFDWFYDAVIAPIVDVLGPQDGELVIVSDGVLCFKPWDPVIESIRIRTVPSLTSY